jgi:hypothetical protein
MSLSALDVNVSDIDVSALGINVSSLDIKTEVDNKTEVDTKREVDFKSASVFKSVDQPDISAVEQTAAQLMNVAIPDNFVKKKLLDTLAADKSVVEPLAEDNFEFAALIEMTNTNNIFQSGPNPSPAADSLSDVKYV